MFEDIRAGVKRFLGFKLKEETLEVRLLATDVDDNGNDVEDWYIVYPDGEAYAGPYRRRADALGQLTRLRKSYTPAARRPRDSVR